MFQENKARQIFRKANISYPLIRTPTCVYQGIKNVCFSESLACFVFLKHPFLDSPFCLITDENNKLIKIVIFNICVRKIIFKHQIFDIHFKMRLTFSTGCAGLTKNLYCKEKPIKQFQNTFWNYIAHNRGFATEFLEQLQEQSSTFLLFFSMEDSFPSCYFQ